MNVIAKELGIEVLDTEIEEKRKNSLISASEAYNLILQEKVAATILKMKTDIDKLKLYCELYVK
jgi:hypothetical protein